MKKYAVVLLVLMVTAVFSGTASAKARGYGLVFDGMENAQLGTLLRHAK